MKFLKEDTIVDGTACPMFQFNYREIEILFAVLTKAEQYIPDLLMPDKGRIKQMLKHLGKYMRQKEIDARRMKIDVDGLQKALVLTAHAMQRMIEREISIDYIRDNLPKATLLTTQATTKIYEYENTKFIIDESGEHMVLITLYENEEVV